MKTQGELARIISTLPFIDGVTRVCPYLLCIMDKKRLRKWKDHLVSTAKKLGLGVDDWEGLQKEEGPWLRH